MVRDQTIEIEALNVTLAADDPDAPLKIDGKLAVRGQPLTVAATVSPVARTARRSASPACNQGFRCSIRRRLSGLSCSCRRVSRSTARSSCRPLRRGPWANGSAVLCRRTAMRTPWPSRPTSRSRRAKWRSRVSRPTSAPATMAGALALENKQQRQHLSGSLDVSELDFGRLLTRPRRTARTQAQPAPTPPPRSSEPPARRRPVRRRTSRAGAEGGATIPSTLRSWARSTPT